MNRTSLKEIDAIQELLSPYRQNIDACLKNIWDNFPWKTCSDSKGWIIKSAIMHSMFADLPHGPKRVRPTLVLMSIEALGVEITQWFIKIASCVEFFHIASLIHDDLPEIDNASIRHGKAVLHKAFPKSYGVGLAVHTGYALPCDANMLLSTPGFVKGIAPDTILKIIHEINLGLGSLGVMRGQTLDLESANRQRTKKEILKIHYYKTAKFFQACTCIGAILANANQSKIDNLSKYGEMFGMIWQITDDIIDQTVSTKESGKTSGLDSDRKTYPDLVGGIDIAKQKVNRLLIETLECLEDFGPSAESLRLLARFATERKK